MRLAAYLLTLLLLGLLLAGGAAVMLVQHYARDLPDYASLRDYEPPTLTRLYADDGRLLAEYATERRVFVPIDKIPPLVIGAFLSAEDKTFYAHHGIDFAGIAQAVVTNIGNLATGRRPVGASTITQQVAKNMLLTNEVSLARKMREAILAWRIEQTLSKDRILELYLNQIFLGRRAYGVAAAALNYFNRPLEDLTVAEAAFLAGLPKAPNNYNPDRQLAAAVARRNWVIGRMQADGRLTAAAAAAAMAAPLVTRQREADQTVTADYFAEEVRRELAARFGDSKVFEQGLVVRTSLHPDHQAIATRVLREGLLEYDQRTGYRGPLTSLPLSPAWPTMLDGVSMPAGSEGWQRALVLAVTAKQVDIGLAGNQRGVIPLAGLQWARRVQAGGRLGPPIKQAGDALRPGEVVMVEGLADQPGQYALRQVPEVQGALVAIDPHTGRVLAMVGGFSSRITVFNRVTQALRQPGSAFKPFVYLAALEAGFTPSSLVLDAPVAFAQGPGLPLWRPENYSEEFYGPTPLRVGIEKSRNVMTVRLAHHVGMAAVVDEARQFGITDTMQPFLAMALGAAETTLLRLTTAYAMLVNGGRQIAPSFIDRVQDRNGRTLWRSDPRPCPDCLQPWVAGQVPPRLPDDRPQVTDPRHAYQMVSMLEGVVERGTATRLRALGRPLAGKTGTTNDAMDAWFIGFSPDLAVGVFVGYDTPRSLGSRETGGSVAVPIFQNFMAAALADTPAIPFRVPPGLRQVRIDPETGQRASPDNPRAIWEAFLPGTEPNDAPTAVLDGSQLPGSGVPETGPAALEQLGVY